ncbi:MAG TPA: Spy/CpxP family protein refolding chaperone [Pyrinomonadaceae bacterium]|jgi:Spy/CpxP family protein refolding chaperone
MNRKRVIGGAAAFAAALLMSVAALAQHGGPGGHHRGPGMHGTHGGPGHHGKMLGHLARELNLTDAQQAQVKQIVESFHESNKGLHEQLMKGGGHGPFEGLKDGVFDEAAVRAAAQARANLHVEMEVTHARLMSQIYALLTPEQKAKVAELRQRHEQKRAQQPPGGERF